MKVNETNKVYGIPYALFLLCAALLILRILVTQKLFFSFLVWNLVLATIPLLIAIYLERRSILGIKKIRLLVLAVIWLLFLPNSFYIITDLKHLVHSGRQLILLDVILVSSFAVSGAIMGFHAIYIMRKVALYFYPRLPGKLLVFCTLFLCGFGVYLGRELRWNSWDILFNPTDLIADILDRIRHPLSYPGTWGFTLIMTAFLSVIYHFFEQLIALKSIKEHADQV